MRSSVVFPTPFGPTTPMRLPSPTTSDTRSNSKRAPCDLLTSLTVIECKEPPDERADTPRWGAKASMSFVSGSAQSGARRRSEF